MLLQSSCNAVSGERSNTPAPSGCKDFETARSASPLGEPSFNSERGDLASDDAHSVCVMTVAMLPLIIAGHSGQPESGLLVKNQERTQTYR